MSDPMNFNAEYVSKRLFSNVLGDSKISLFQQADKDELSMLIVDNDSADFLLLKDVNGDFTIITEDGVKPERYTIIDKITEKQLADVGKLLTILFPVI
jgi:hypothetical protein